MNRIGGMATRTTVIVAVFLAFLMLGLPAMNLGGNNVGSGAVGNAEAVIADRVYTVGWIGFTGDFTTMNPFLYTMAAEYAVIWQCASFLLMYDMENQMIGDLAENFTVLPDGVTFHFDLVRNAWWIDPLDPTAQTELVTWEDVAWTYWEINNNTKNHLHSYLPEIIESISMRDGDPFKVEIVLKSSYAPFLPAMTSIPVMPEHIWSGVDPMKFSNLPMVSSGSFYYPSTVLPKSEARLYSNTLYYQQENRGWQMHNGQLVFRNEGDAGTGMLELENGIIDTLVGVPPAVYVTQVLPGLIPNVYGQAQSTGFVYEFNLNQLTPELRAELGWKTGANNPLLLRPEIKLAFQMCFDKQTFVDDVLLGLGTIGDSLVPDVNPWHYTYGLQESEDPILGRAPDGEEPVAFNPTAARQMLMDHGWAYAADGTPAVATTVPLYKKGDTNATVYWPLSFNCYSLLPEQEWAEGTNLIAGDAAEAGILLHGESSESDPPTLLQSSQMNTLWYSGDYDTWLWDWFFSPLSEVCTDVMSVLTTAEIGSWSDVYWSNATYDELYLRALYSTDPVARMNLTDRLQRMAYEDSGCNAVAYRKELYGLNTQKWTNYGNWERYFMLMPDWSMPYLYSMFSPTDNHAPTVQVQQSFTGDINVAKSIPITANDDMSTTLEYRWFWGDGTKSDWMTSNTNSHAYKEDGVYTCYVAARETNTPAGSTDDYFISWNKTKLTISDPTNDAPTGLSISISPLDPDTGTDVLITGSATDPEGDDLYFSWTFGDTYTGLGQSVSHQWTSTGIYTLAMSVTDNHIGTGTRPAQTSTLVSVTANGPPSISVPDMADIQWKTSILYTVAGSDPNVRDTLRYTWDWGDGSISVTTIPQAYHTYTQQGVKTLEVFLDDLTGLPGHNVSDIGLIEVVNVGNIPPVIDAFGVDDSTPYTYQMVTFTGEARDAEGDSLTWTFAFADGTYEVVTTPVSAPNATVPVSVQHAYSLAMSYTAYLYVFDGAVNRTSSGVAITVMPNDPPVLDPLTDFYGDTGNLVSFSASAFDPDDDPLTYWWDFADGSPLEGGLDMASVTHTYAASGSYQYGVFVDDGAGHNVTDRSWVYQSLPPTIDPLADQTFSTGVSKDVTASATDPDGDTLYYTWDFGDGTPLVVGNPASHTYASAGIYTITVWADDLFPVAGHNVSTTATATVSDVLLPPVADAGPDQNVMALELVTFDGSGSSDADGTIVAWYWTFNYDGTDYNLSGETQSFTFTTEPVTVVVTLTVVDDDGIADQDSMSVIISGVIPEFVTVFVPVAGMLILLVGLSRWQKKRSHT